ncbi:MAG: Luciferase-like monooxygenase, partial [Actinomycetia bacterium]|nr:Luciferase-like monooxygenase [Actinomycetes bacterium]
MAGCLPACGDSLRPGIADHRARAGPRSRPIATSLQYGLITPALTQLPRAHAGWESDATIDDIASIAEAAERLGYRHITCSEHVAIPTEVAKVRGGTYWDPLATFGYIAARTTTLELATFVLVLGYHHPLEIVKRYGTLDRVSAGRLILGVGVGSLQEEFELVGAPFDDRGARGDESLRALRASWGVSLPEFHGEYYDYADMLIDPTAPRTHVPIWIGGRTQRSLRRAVELGDAWAPFGLSTAEMGAMVAKARDT